MVKAILGFLGTPFGGWLVAGGAALLIGWAALEKIEVARLDKERVRAVAERDSARETAARNAAAANLWKGEFEKEQKRAADLKEAGDEAIARADDAEEAAAAAARAAEKGTVVYVQDIARISMPCGLVRLLDDAADDSPGAGTDRRRAELSAASGCTGKADRDLARFGFDRLVDAFIWLAEDRRRAKARADGLARWFQTQWATP